jgi:hypothetical protein
MRDNKQEFVLCGFLNSHDKLPCHGKTTNSMVCGQTQAIIANRRNEESFIHRGHKSKFLPPITQHFESACAKAKI